MERKDEHNDESPKDKGMAERLEIERQLDEYMLKGDNCFAENLQRFRQKGMIGASRAFQDWGTEILGFVEKRSGRDYAN